jgi:hypothetical protein
MALEELVRSHVERCLQDVWELCRVQRDDDGDYPFRAGRAACWVHVDVQEPVLVRVVAHAVVGVKRSYGLLREINDVNGRSRAASVVWGHGIVLVSGVIHPDGLSRTSLEHMLDTVTTVANDIGPMMAHVYGGSTPFEAEPEEAVN